MRTQNTSGHDARRSSFNRKLALGVALSVAVVSSGASAGISLGGNTNPLRSETTRRSDLRTPVSVETHRDITATQDVRPVARVKTERPKTDSEVPMMRVRMIKGKLVDTTNATSFDPSTPSGLATDAISLPAAAAEEEEEEVSPLAVSPLKSGDSVAILPTTGRFVKSGSDWQFVPSTGQATYLVDGTNSEQQQRTRSMIDNRFRSDEGSNEVSANEFRKSVQNFVQLFPNNPFRDSVHGAMQVPASWSDFDQAAAPAPVAASFDLGSVEVSKDLILQRVLQTLRKSDLSKQLAADPVERSLPSQDSDEWAVTGQITLANGQQVLHLHTARQVTR